MGKPDGRSQESGSVTGTRRPGRVFPAIRPSHREQLVAPVLLALLLASTMGCVGAATDSPFSPTRTPEATRTPTTPAETDTLTPTSTLAMLQEILAPTNTPTVPIETPTTVSTPVVPAETPTASPHPTPQARAATPTPAPTETPAPIEGPVVRIGDALFSVDLALTPEQRSQGLSGRHVMAAETGMLFVFENEGALTFWMKEMRFPLDIVWIGADCTVVDVTLGAPPPEEGQGLADLPRFSPRSPAQYVLEINAGEFVDRGIEAGDLVEFAGDLDGLHGC